MSFPSRVDFYVNLVVSSSFVSKHTKNLLFLSLGRKRLFDFLFESVVIFHIIYALELLNPEVMQWNSISFLPTRRFIDQISFVLSLIHFATGITSVIVSEVGFCYECMEQVNHMQHPFMHCRILEGFRFLDRTDSTQDGTGQLFRVRIEQLIFTTTSAHPVS